MDQPAEVILCKKGELFVLITQEGHLLGVNIDELSYSTEERIKLDVTDHVVAGFVIQPEETLLCLTQTGKVIARKASFIEPTKSTSTRGQTLIPSSRLEQGVRFIGATRTMEPDRIVVLDETGRLSMHAQSEVTGEGAVLTREHLLAFCAIPEKQLNS
jgi:DNA gyrase/topoisomerase IV subunit A